MASNLVSSPSGAAAGVSGSTGSKHTRSGPRARFTAAAAHLLISIAMAAGVLGVVYFGWYPKPLDALSGVGEILLMLLAIDVTLGPMLTFIIFDRRKKSLTFDLSCIAVMQIAAMAYGLHVVEAGRPHYIVFVKDRFELVSRADLRQEDRAGAMGNRAAEVDWLAPRIVAAQMPESAQERRDLMFESVAGGRDAQHFPKRYRDYATHAAQAATKGTPLADLRLLNPDRSDLLQAAVARSRRVEDGLRFLPIKGPQRDASMLLDASTGAIVGMVDLQPWR